MEFELAVFVNDAVDAATEKAPIKSPAFMPSLTPPDGSFSPAGSP